MRQILGNAIVASHLGGQRSLPYSDPALLDAARDRRARSLIRHAAAHVPHYRDWFARARVDPRDLRRADELRALPLLTKEEVRADPARCTARSARARGALAFVTSGTTGERSTILHDRVSLLANIAWGERERAVLQTVLASSRSRRELAILHGGSTVLQVWDFYARHTWVPARPQRTRLGIDLPLADVLGRIESERPDVLMGYGSYLELLFRAAAARGGLAHRPAAVLYGADAMSPEARRHLEQELGVRVLSTYSAAEAFKIGFACEAGTGFHVHADLCHLRLVDATGADVPAGVPGEVVISNLVNRATVLVNYRLGDVATWSETPCPCGRTLPLLATLAGRSEDVVELAGGALLHPRSVWSIVKQQPEVLRYQLVQHAPERLELRLMTAGRAAYDGLAPGLLGALRELAAGAQVETSFAPDLGLATPGKFRTVVALPRTTP